MRIAKVVIFVLSIGVGACISPRGGEHFCAPSAEIDLVASEVDPAGRLQRSDVPIPLRAAILAYLRGQICGRPACDLFRSKEDVKACKDGYLATRAILRKRIKIVYIDVDAVGGLAAVEIQLVRGGRNFAAWFRRSNDGSWFVFEPLWEAGVGVP